MSARLQRSYNKALSRQAIETRERALQVLKTGSILNDGSPPRYERLGFYMDFSEWDDPSYSTREDAQRLLDDLGNGKQEPPESLGNAIDAAVELVAMRHFQFAGAPDVRDRLVEGSELALAYFQACAAIPNRVIPSPGSRSEGCCTHYCCAHWRNAGRRSRRSATPSGPSWRRRIRPTMTSMTMRRCCCCLSRTIAIGRCRMPQYWSRLFRNAELDVLVCFWMCAAPSPRVEKPILRKRSGARSRIL